MRNYYDMLTVARDAPADEIKKAFRREIAKYHPDKVQHLGREFQEMASGIAADLTEGYRILMDPALRAKYDGQLAAGAQVHPAGAPPPRPPTDDPDPAPAEPSTSATGAESRPGSAGGGAAAPPRPSADATAGVDFVRRATLSKIKHAISEVLASASAMGVPGFDISFVTKPKKGLFKKAEESICLLVKFVPQVDADAVATSWPAAMKVRAPEASGCVLMLVGPGMAPVQDLSAAISDLRRKARVPGPVLVPVDVRDWEALFPADTPTAVRTIIQRLKDEKR